MSVIAVFVLSYVKVMGSESDVSVRNAALVFAGSSVTFFVPQKPGYVLSIVSWNPEIV